MKLIRLTDEEIVRRYSEQTMRCPTHLSIGQEAVPASVGLALRAGDSVVSTHRSHGHYLGKGGDLKRMIAELYGKATGCSRGKGGSMHLIDIAAGFMGSTAIVGNTIPVGVGLALALKLDGSSSVCCVFLGDAAVEEGVFYESVNFAVVQSLPVLFVCENNLYSVYSPLRVRQPSTRAIHHMVAGLGLQVGHGDGNDAPGVHRMITDAVEGIRRDGKPRFLELATYRWREHCGPNYDNDIGYRAEDEFHLWRARDPVDRLEQRLVARGVLSRAQIAEMERQLRAEVDAAFRFAEESPFPEPAEALLDVYKA